MKLLHYILALPLIAVAAWAIYCADSADGIAFSFWSGESEQESFSTKLILFVFLIYGYFCGRLGAWFANAPVRHELRRQKRANKMLSKEQTKLNETVSGLQQNVASLQEKAKAQSAAENTQKKGWAGKIKSKFATKKEA